MYRVLHRMDRQLTELRRYIDAYTLAKNEREGERKGGRGARIWELNETLRHRRNRRGAKLFSPLAGREGWLESIWTGKEDKLWIVE